MTVSHQQDFAGTPGVMTMNEGAHLDADIIAELKDIMEDDFSILLETYLDDASQKLAAIKTTLDNNDSSEVRELAHSLKGASCNIGALPLSRICESVEHLAKDGKLDEVAPHIPDLEIEFSAVKTLLGAYLN